MNILFLSNNQMVSEPLFEEMSKWEKTSVISSSQRIDKRFLFDHHIDWIVSYGYMYLITKSVLDAVGYNAVNLHISLLPWNRGADPNFWSFAEATPKGVTVHMIDEGADTGAIVAQKECFFNEKEETLSTTYQSLHKTIRDIFVKSFPLLITGKTSPQLQVGHGTVHRERELIEFKKYLGSLLYEIPVSDVLVKYHDFLRFNPKSK